MAKAKTRAVGVAVPQNRAEAERMLSDMGAAQRELTIIETAMSEEIAVVTENYETLAQPHKQAIKDQTEGLRIWAEANRKALTDNGKKQGVRLATGDLKWRVTPPKVALTGISAVIDNLLRAGKTQFVRTKQEVNKEAILNDPDAVRGIKGIRIKQGEDFVCEPTTAELTEVGS